jgi:hypothetical protein
MLPLLPLDWWAIDDVLRYLRSVGARRPRIEHPAPGDEGDS